MRPIRRNDSRLWARILYTYSDIYNYCFRKIFGNILDKKINSGMHISHDKNSILRASATKTAWLLNIDRCFKMLRLIAGYSNEEIKHFRWIDVGCGNGLASIYVANKYKIKSQFLFDFDLRCISQAKQNYKIFNNSLLGKLFHISKPIFKNIDASIEKIPNNFKGINIIYLYDPFDQYILKKFIKINDEIFKKEFIIFYLNDINRKIIFEELKNKITKYRRNNFYEISIFYFR